MRRLLLASVILGTTVGAARAQTIPVKTISPEPTVGAACTESNGSVYLRKSSGQHIECKVTTPPNRTWQVVNLTGGTAANPAGSNQDVQINASSVFGAAPGFTANTSTGLVSMSSATIAGALTATLTGDSTQHRKVSAGLRNFRTSDPTVGVKLHTSSSFTKHQLIQGLGSGFYWEQDLYQRTINLGPGYTVQALDNSRVVKAALTADNGDGSITESGTWANASSALAYGGSVRYSNTTSDYVEGVTPATATAVGVRNGRFANGGLALVTLDGSTTAANRCKTAQQLVDDGYYANTILVANGGNLNPTDRVIDGYQSAGDYDVLTPVATGLSAAAHTIRLTVTGYKRSAASDTRVYFGGYMHTDGTLTFDDPNTDGLSFYSVRDVWNLNSTDEYAIFFHPTGGSATFIGNGHGYENSAAFVVYVDGSPITLTNKQRRMGGDVEIVRTSELFHPNVGAGSTKVADGTTVYRMDGDGLYHSHEVVWTASGAGTIDRMFSPMMTLDRDVFDRCTTGAATQDYTISGSGTEFGTALAGSTVSYCWDHGGEVGAFMWMSDPELTVGSWALSATNKTYILDNTGVAANRYVKLYQKAVDTPSTITTTAGTVTKGSGFRRVRVFRDADQALGR